MRGRLSCRRGAAAVEFAMVAPLLFMLIFGMIEFGRIIMVLQIITNAAREGARVAVLDGATPGTVSTTVNRYLKGGSVNGATVAIDPAEPNTAGYGEPVTVTVQVPVNAVTWISTPTIVPSSVRLRSAAIMRRETVQ